jgi:hypothetical protein
MTFTEIKKLKLLLPAMLIYFQQNLSTKYKFFFQFPLKLNKNLRIIAQYPIKNWKQNYNTLLKPLSNIFYSIKNYRKDVDDGK